ncbi:hypothetical protein PROFUN_16665 [Planoprotostelium fungivorum]|uniref:Uncharacterized protein n=1 Tax=Planoprotostelium fungivorum TaxID=1890364 RepID=A0A2P6MPR7_9EUKA|nr:hypothetical protein PROFUN_16665 [Planoprotostelium fungivorum]
MGSERDVHNLNAEFNGSALLLRPEVSEHFKPYECLDVAKHLANKYLSNWSSQVVPALREKLRRWDDRNVKTTHNDLTLRDLDIFLRDTKKVKGEDLPSVNTLYGETCKMVDTLNAKLGSLEFRASKHFDHRDLFATSDLTLSFFNCRAASCSYINQPSEFRLYCGQCDPLVILQLSNLIKVILEICRVPTKFHCTKNNHEHFGLEEMCLKINKERKGPQHKLRWKTQWDIEKSKREESMQAAVEKKKSDRKVDENFLQSINNTSLFINDYIYRDIHTSIEPSTIPIVVLGLMPSSPSPFQSGKPPEHIVFLFKSILKKRKYYYQTPTLYGELGGMPQ